MSIKILLCMLLSHISCFLNPLFDYILLDLDVVPKWKDKDLLSMFIWKLSKIKCNIVGTMTDKEFEYFNLWSKKRTSKTINRYLLQRQISGIVFVSIVLLSVLLLIGAT